MVWLRRAFTLVGIACLTCTGCAPIAILGLNIDRDAYTRHVDLPYGDDPRQKLDLYVPVAAADIRRPVIVWIYGGSWRDGNKGDYEFVASWLASRGYPVAIPDYRLVPQVRFPAFLEDIAAAVAALPASGGLLGASGDASRVVIMGHSAGAYNAAMVALDPTWLRGAGARVRVAAFIGLAGPYDFFPFHEAATINAFGHTSDPAETQPVRRVAPDAPPALLLHGVTDTTVYPENSQSLAGVLRAQGDHVTLVLLEDTGHIDILKGLSPLFRDQEIITPVEQFLERVAGGDLQAAVRLLRSDPPALSNIARGPIVSPSPTTSNVWRGLWSTRGVHWLSCSRTSGSRLVPRWPSSRWPSRDTPPSGWRWPLRLLAAAPSPRRRGGRGSRSVPFAVLSCLMRSSWDTSRNG